MTVTQQLPAGSGRTGPGRLPGRVSVVVADDHARFRAGLVRGLARRPELEVVAEAVDGREALALVRCLRPQIALVDLRMPSLGGLAVTRMIREDPLLRDVHVVLLSARSDPALRDEAMRAGATRFFEKTTSRSVLWDALLAIARSGGA